MEPFIKEFRKDVSDAFERVSIREIEKALGILQAVYERNGRIYVFGNGGSLALATHFVADLNKTVFSHHLDKHKRRFQAMRLPSTEREITALAKRQHVPVIGFSGFDGGKLNKLADAKVLVPTEKGAYEVVESVHAALLHMMVKYFKNAFDYMVETGKIK